MIGERRAETRIAVFSDVHGNSIALDAVLVDIERSGRVDAHWFLGDAAALGFDPVGVVERLVGLPGLVAVRGNGDRRVTTVPEIVWKVTERFLAPASDDDAFIWRSTLADCEWTRDGLEKAGCLEWLSGLPLEQRVTLPDGTRLLMVHAAPGTDEGPGINEGQTDDDLRKLVGGADADMVFVGHTHRALDRTVGGVRAINVGSVSNPPGEEKRAMWTLVVANESGYSIKRRLAEYDIAAVRERLEREQPPAWVRLLKWF
jgi:predicted phosphodiesterase